MSDRPKNRSRVWIGWAALVILILYPLSVGPVCWLIVVTGADWLGVVYWPLDWAANACQPVEQLLTWYQRLWHLPGA
ncbi:MAG TPA: hypothetical protein VFG04_00300 [Planctomycetaceae bacterium]|nr:hypothetical protein [Planctomycetaceae bacterium]